MQYLRKFFWANKTVEWVRDIRKAKQFKFRASAETSGERVSTAAASTSIYVVDSKTHKIVQRRYCGPEQNLEEKMPEKRSFRIQMKHEVGYQIDVTYEATTEMEALDQMFEEVKKMPNKPFTAGSIKMHEGTVCDTDDAGKSM